VAGPFAPLLAIYLKWREFTPHLLFDAGYATLIALGSTRSAPRREAKMNRKTHFTRILLL